MNLSKFTQNPSEIQAEFGHILLLVFYDAFVCNLFGGGGQTFTLLMTKKLNSFKNVKLKTIVNICQTFETKKLKKNQFFCVIWFVGR